MNMPGRESDHCRSGASARAGGCDRISPPGLGRHPMFHYSHLRNQPCLGYRCVQLVAAAAEKHSTAWHHGERGPPGHGAAGADRNGEELAPRRSTRFAQVWAAALCAAVLLRAAESLFVIYLKNFSALNAVSDWMFSK